MSKSSSQCVELHSSLLLIEEASLPSMELQQLVPFGVLPGTLDLLSWKHCERTR